MPLLYKLNHQTDTMCIRAQSGVSRRVQPFAGHSYDGCNALSPNIIPPPIIVRIFKRIGTIIYFPLWWWYDLEGVDQIENPLL